MLSSHVKRSPSLWLHNKSRLFHWCLYNKQNITCPLMDMNFIFSWSTRYLTRSLRSLVRYRVDHSKIKFISTRGHVISSIYDFIEFYEMVYFPIKHSCPCNKQYHVIEFIDMIAFSGALSILHQRNLKRRLHSKNAPNVPYMYRVCQSFFCFRVSAYWQRLRHGNRKKTLWHSGQFLWINVNIPNRFLVEKYDLYSICHSSKVCYLTIGPCPLLPR